VALIEHFRGDLRVIRLEKEQKAKRDREIALAQLDAIHCHLDDLQCRLSKVDEKAEKRNGPSN
jgi:hypothetical protein